MGYEKVTEVMEDYFNGTIPRLEEMIKLAALTMDKQIVREVSSQLDELHSLGEEK